MDKFEKQQVLINAAQSVLKSIQLDEPLEVQEQIFNDAIFKVTDDE